jgi:predicted N-acetyltransferase YhbS
VKGKSGKDDLPMKLDQEIVVTCCASAHAEAVSELLQGALTATGAGASSGQAETAAHYSKEQIIRDMAGRLTYVAVQRHRVVGVVILSGTESTGTRIEALCVAPEHQGRGIGELLIETAEKRAGELGITCLGVSGTVTNKEFFTRYGYLAGAQEHMLEKALA